MLDPKTQNFDNMSVGELMDEMIDTFDEVVRGWDGTKHKVNATAWRKIRRKLDAICKAKKVIRKKMIDIEHEAKGKRVRKEEIDHEALIYSA